ncbi:MAG: hypothetical protein JWN02_521 [Acidobacteria bacterium]|nr:hypothetical protein [Acidobacteriota bacterium]
MKRLLIAVFAMTLVAGAAAANEGHGGGPGPGNNGPADLGRDGGEHGAIVGSDGTVYVVKATSTTTNGSTTVTRQVVAIRSTGTTAWTVTLPAGARDLELSGSNLLTVTESSTTTGGITTATSTLTAISTNSGATAWTRTIDGRVGELTPFSGGTYVFVTKPATTSGGSATHSLVAVGNDGAVLWTVSLD